jgi:hypothetical protein
MLGLGHICLKPKKLSEVLKVMKGGSILQFLLHFYSHRLEVGHEIYDDMMKLKSTTAT